MVSSGVSLFPEVIRKSSEVSGKLEHFQDLGLL